MIKYKRPRNIYWFSRSWGVEHKFFVHRNKKIKQVPTIHTAALLEKIDWENNTIYCVVCRSKMSNLTHSKAKTYRSANRIAELNI